MKTRATNSSGGGCSPDRTGLSLQMGEKQGDSGELQGGAKPHLAKSHQISIAWNGVSLLKRAGKSRENHLCPAGWRSRLRPDTGDCPLEPVLASNLQHLHFSECQLESWERTRWDSELGTLTPQLKLLGLDRCRQSRCGNRSEAKRRALALADNKIVENAASCWPSSYPSSPSSWCSKASTLRSPGRKSSLFCGAGNVGS